MEAVSKVLLSLNFRAVRIPQHWDLYFTTETFQLGDVCWHSWSGGWRYEVPLWRGSSYSVARCVVNLFECSVVGIVLMLIVSLNNYCKCLFLILMSVSILWFCLFTPGELCDLILVFFDPMGQALCKRTLNIVEKLNEKQGDRLRFYLSKADEAGGESDRQVRRSYTCKIKCINTVNITIYTTIQRSICLINNTVKYYNL